MEKKLIEQIFQEEVGPFIHITKVNVESGDETQVDVLANVDMVTYDDDDGYKRHFEPGESIFCRAYTKYQGIYYHTNGDGINEVMFHTIPEVVRVMFVGEPREIIQKFIDENVTFCLSGNKQETLMIHKGRSHKVACDEMYNEFRDRDMIGPYGELTGNGDYDIDFLQDNAGYVARCLKIIS